MKNEVEDNIKMSTSEEEKPDENSTLDEDTCTPFELAQTFAIKYKIVDQSAVTLKKDYVLSLCQDSAFTRIAAGLTDATVQLFDVNAQRGLSHHSTEDIPAPSNDSENSVCGVRFLDETPNLLLVGTTNGLVRLFDLRADSKREQARFENTASAPSDNGGNNFAPKTITCFDRNANGRVVCAGTEQFQNNVFLLFYDVRERKQLGGYFESHQDDVTSVRFHDENADLLCSGSTDGLINVYDIREPNEDDALQVTINTESSVHKLNWHRNSQCNEVISCITHTNDFHLYECEEGDLIKAYSRSKITKAMKRQNVGNCNLVNSHNMENNDIFVLCGTNYQKGEVLRTLSIDDKNKLRPMADFEGNKQIVRESIYNAKYNAIVTAGESGIVSLWSMQNDETPATTKTSKMKSKTKHITNSTTPY